MVEPEIRQPIVDRSPKRAGIRAFVTRHDTLFTILGALGVFFGFYIKDIYLEQLSSFQSKMQMADQNRVILTEAAATYSSMAISIADINRKLSSIQGKVDENDAGRLEHCPFAGLVMMQGFARSAHDNATWFLASLPESPVTLRERSQNILAQSMTLFREGVEITKLQPQLTAKNTAALAEFEKECSQYQSGVAVYKTDVDQFTADVNRYGEMEESQLESKEHLASRCSVILFILGWALGLAGKILKIPALRGGSDD